MDYSKAEFDPLKGSAIQDGAWEPMRSSISTSPRASGASSGAAADALGHQLWRNLGGVGEPGDSPGVLAVVNGGTTEEVVQQLELGCRGAGALDRKGDHGRVGRVAVLRKVGQHTAFGDIEDKGRVTATSPGAHVGRLPRHVERGGRVGRTRRRRDPRRPPVSGLDTTLVRYYRAGDHAQGGGLAAAAGAKQREELAVSDLQRDVVTASALPKRLLTLSRTIAAFPRPPRAESSAAGTQ